MSVGKLGFFQSDSEFGHLHILGPPGRGRNKTSPQLQSFSRSPQSGIKDSERRAPFFYTSSPIKQCSTPAHGVSSTACGLDAMHTMAVAMTFNCYGLIGIGIKLLQQLLEGATLGDPFVIQRPCRQYTESGEETKKEGEEQQVDVDGRSG